MEDASAKPSKRLASLLAMIDELDDADMRLLPLLLGEKLTARERACAAMLQQYVGGRCSVLWPGEGELYDVTLIAVDVEKGLARVALRRDGPSLDVPPFTVDVDDTEARPATSIPAQS